MNLLAVDLVARDPSEVDEMVASLWTERPIPDDYRSEAEYTLDIEMWYDRMKEMGEAIAEANEIEQEINSIGLF